MNYYDLGDNPVMFAWVILKAAYEVEMQHGVTLGYFLQDCTDISTDCSGRPNEVDVFFNCDQYSFMVVVDLDEVRPHIQEPCGPDEEDCIIAGEQKRRMIERLRELYRKKEVIQH